MGSHPPAGRCAINRRGGAEQPAMHSLPTLHLNAAVPHAFLQDFFKPKHIIIRLRDEEKWGPAQREALYKVTVHAALSPCHLLDCSC